MEKSKTKMDKTQAQPLKRPILGGTKNGTRPQRYSYWRTGYAGPVPSILQFWVKQAGEYHTDKPFVSGDFEYSDVDQFYYHLEGEAKFKFEGGEYALQVGDLLLIPKGEAYLYETTEGVRLHWFCLSGRFSYLEQDKQVSRLSLGPNQLIESTFVLMREVLILNRPGSAMRAVSLVYELLSLIEAIQAPLDKKAIYPDAVRVAISYMREHYQETFVADQVAQACGVTAPHLRTLFQKWVGESPHQSHTRYRIERAEQLLLEQDLTVAEVGYQVGYSDPYYFSRVFKKLTGYRPSRYKTVLVSKVAE
ncbi:MAG: helix-turn-helix domain-containing protein [Anaerolineae bacterium]